MVFIVLYVCISVSTSLQPGIGSKIPHWQPDTGTGTGPSFTVSLVKGSVHIVILFLKNVIYILFSYRDCFNIRKLKVHVTALIRV